jgi:hypothetical protein
MRPWAVLGLAIFSAAAMVIGQTPTSIPLVPCVFLAPFVRWVPSAGCPANGTPQSCHSDQDCRSISSTCAYGGTQELICSPMYGSSVCSIKSDALPTLQRPGGYCDPNMGEMCTLCLSEPCIHVAQCLDQSVCQGKPAENYRYDCFPAGHSIDQS